MKYYNSITVQSFTVLASSVLESAGGGGGGGRMESKLPPPLKALTFKKTPYV